MAFLVYNCGCKFRITEPGYTTDVRAEDCHGKLPKIYLSINPEEPESIHNINLDCQGVWDMIGRGDVKGIFQIEKDLGKTWSLKTQPRSIEDLSALISLIRPGCLKAYSGDPPKSMTQRYADRKMGEEPVTYLHQAIAECLKTTYGILTYQEQAMRIAEVLAGFNKQEADVLRKAIGKKKADIMAKVEKEFLTKAEALGVVTLADAKEIFGWIRESQKYSFNKCLSPNTIVETEDGFKTIYDLEVGENIKTPEGMSTVLDKIDSGYVELYEVTLESGKTIECSLEHQFLCSDGKKRRLFDILENNLEIMCEDE